MRRALATVISVLLVAALAVVVVRQNDARAGVPALGTERADVATKAAEDRTPAVADLPTTTTTLFPPPTQPPVGLAPPAGPVPLEGCPPPPPRPGTGRAPVPWHPAVLVPDAELPAPLEAAARTTDLRPLTGKGMWLWKYRQTEAGDPEAIVRRAVDAGLHQLWVRVGDSRDGFYAADVLDGLVTVAHRHHLAVIGWGFPYLYDPVGDAAWTAAALDWRGPGGEALDGFSPDIEMDSEGVALSARRAAVYLGMVRRSAGDRLVVATVYRPSDRILARNYPYDAIAPYVDAFAPMVYWGCTEPGQAVTQTLERLAAMRPLHLIGQAYNMASEGGRPASPSAAETLRFLDVAQRGGALGGSLWVWQDMTDDEWAALTGFAWAPRP